MKKVSNFNKKTKKNLGHSENNQISATLLMEEHSTLLEFYMFTDQVCRELKKALL